MHSRMHHSTLNSGRGFDSDSPTKTRLENINKVTAVSIANADLDNFGIELTYAGAEFDLPRFFGPFIPGERPQFQRLYRQII